jgi:hypothetical protein
VSRRHEQLDAERRRAAATARKARYRKLLAAGGAHLSVPLKDLNGLITVLLDLQWLPETKSEDRKEIGIAIGLMLDDLAVRHARGTAD